MEQLWVLFWEMIAAMRQKYLGGYSKDVLCDYRSFCSKFRVPVVLQLLFGVIFPILPIALWNQGFVPSILPTLALSISPIADSAWFREKRKW